MLSRVVFVVLALDLVAGPAHAGSLSLDGSAGYLSEWQISATVSDGAAAGAEALSGPVTLRHTGVCAVAGPAEKSGEMEVRISGWGPLAKVEVSMRFAGTQCVYRGGFSKLMTGVMDCSDARGIPLELSVR